MQVPIGEVRFHFAKVADIADVITNSIGIAECVIDAITAQLLDAVDALQNAGCIFTSAAQVIDFAWARVFGKRFEGTNDICAFDLIANLFAFVSKDRIGFAMNGDVNQIGEEAVQLDTRMRCPVKQPPRNTPTFIPK